MSSLLSDFLIAQAAAFCAVCLIIITVLFSAWWKVRRISRLIERSLENVNDVQRLIGEIAELKRLSHLVKGVHKASRLIRRHK